MEVKSNVWIYIENKGGKLIGSRSGHNLITDAGLNYFRDLTGGTVGRADGQGVGTGTTAAAAGDTALGALVIKKTIDRRLDSDKVITFQALVLTTEANGSALSEIGLFYGSVLIARALISPVIDKDSSMQLTISHEGTFKYEV